MKILARRSVILLFTTAILLLAPLRYLGQVSKTPTRTGHAGDVTSVAISPDSKLVASGGKDGTVRIWETSNGREIATLRAPISDESATEAVPDVVNCVKFSPDGSVLAVAFESSVDLWITGKWGATPQKQLSYSGIKFLAFSPDNLKLAMAQGQPDSLIPDLSEPSIEIWDFEKADITDTIDGACGPVAFHPRNKDIIAYSNAAGMIFIDDRASEERPKGSKRKADDERVAALTFNKSGEYLYSLAGGDGLSSPAGVRVWRSSDHSLASKLNIQSSDLILSHPDGKSIIISGGVGSTTSLSVVDPISGAISSELPRSDVNVGGIAAISEDGKTIVSVDQNGHDIRIVDLTAKKLRSTLKGHSVFVWSLAFTSDDKELVTGYDDGTVVTWDHKTGALLRIAETEKLPASENPFLSAFGDNAEPVVLFPDAARYLSGTSANKVYDSTTGKILKKLPAIGAFTISFSANGNLVALSENKAVSIFDTSTGKLLKRFSVTGDKELTPTNTAFGPDGKTIAVCGAALTFRDATTGLIKRPIIGGAGCRDNVAISYDGKYLVSAMGERIDVFSLITGRVVYQLKEKDWFFAISPDSKKLAIGLHSGSLELYDLASGKPVYSIESAFRLEIANIAMTFNHDGRLIAVGTDRGAFVFTAADGKLVRKVE